MSATRRAQARRQHAARTVAERKLEHVLTRPVVAPATTDLDAWARAQRSNSGVGR